MIEQNNLHILEYNIRREALTTMAPLLHDEKISQFDILAIEEPWYNPHNKSSYNPSDSSFYLAHRPEPDTRTCFYINKRLDLESWQVEDSGGDLCSIKLLIKDKHLESAGQRKEIWIQNIYNPSPASYTSIISLSTLPKIKQALQKEGG